MKTIDQDSQKELSDETLISCFKRACKERGGKEFFTDPTLRLSGEDYYVQTLPITEYMKGYDNYEELISDHLPVMLRFSIQNTLR